MDHDHLFRFESDFVASLRCIPMAVRFKLDEVGIKLSLRQWSHLTVGDRQFLLTMPCSEPAEIDTYRAELQRLVALRTGEAASTGLPAGSRVAWDARSGAPDEVNRFAASRGAAALTDETWQGLADLQRFVLLKLSRDNHDNVNFIPALKEFALYLPSPARCCEI